MVVGDGSLALAPGAPQWKYLETAVAVSGPALDPLPAPGRVDIDERRSVSIWSPLAGRVESVAVRLGDPVARGARLFSVRSAALAELDRDVAQAQQAVAVKRRTAERARALVAMEAAPEKEAAAAEADLRDAELALRTAVSRKASVDVDPDGDNLFWVRSPRAGTVVEMALTASQQVGPDRDRPLLRVADLDEVLVLADVAEGDAADLRRGAPVRITTRGGLAERPGVVERVSSVVDPRRRTVEVRVRADNRDRALRPNAFAEVAFQADPGGHGIRVPEEAVVSEGTRSFVFVAQGGGRLVRQEVALGRHRDGSVEIRRGLDPGARFVTRGALLLLNQLDLEQ